LEALGAFTLKQASAWVPVAEIRQKVGISPAMSFDWTRKRDGLL
jgi:hypothetical protein